MSTRKRDSSSLTTLAVAEEVEKARIKKRLRPPPR
jgi:hypothetical protein